MPGQQQKGGREKSWQEHKSQPATLYLLTGLVIASAVKGAVFSLSAWASEYSLFPSSFYFDRTAPKCRHWPHLTFPSGSAVEVQKKTPEDAGPRAQEASGVLLVVALPEHDVPGKGTGAASSTGPRILQPPSEGFLPY